MNVCVSHMEDADGIISACMISKLFNTHNILVDYSRFLTVLRELTNTQLEQLFICDIGISKSTQQDFMDIIRILEAKGVNITYIDHHDLSNDLKNDLVQQDVRLIHDTNECTSVIIYYQFKDRLEDRYKLLASAAAIVDMMDKTPIASTLANYDRQFLFFETVMLSYAIYASQDDMNFLQRLVEELKSEMPHEIDGVMERAKRFADQVSSIIPLIEKREISNEFAYIYINDPISTGVAANILLTMKQLKVALAYKEKDDGYVISLRGAENYDKHLGRIVNTLAYKVGGSGGGHKLACGAFIPKNKFNEFINELKYNI